MGLAVVMVWLISLSVGLIRPSLATTEAMEPVVPAA